MLSCLGHPVYDPKMWNMWHTMSYKNDLWILAFKSIPNLFSFRIATNCFRLLWIAADFYGLLRMKLVFCWKMQTRRAGDFWRESFDIFPTPGCYMCSAKGRAVICVLPNIPNNLATAKNFLEEWQKFGKNTKSTKYQQVSTDYVICFNKLKKKVKCHCPWSDKKADSAFAATQIFYFLSVVFISQWWAPHMFIWQSWQQCKLTIKMTLFFISKEHQKDYI